MNNSTGKTRMWIVVVIQVYFTFGFVKGQTPCFFGESENCAFLCGCAKNSDSSLDQPCDPITGNCTSGECLEGFHLRMINGARTCQPGI